MTTLLPAALYHSLTRAAEDTHCPSVSVGVGPPASSTLSRDCGEDGLRALGTSIGPIRDSSGVYTAGRPCHRAPTFLSKLKEEDHTQGRDMLRFERVVSGREGRGTESISAGAKTRSSLSEQWSRMHHGEQFAMSIALLADTSQA